MHSCRHIGLTGAQILKNIVIDVMYVSLFSMALRRDMVLCKHMKQIGAGDWLHIDLIGPPPPSRQGHVYIMTYIDVYIRYLVTLPLRNKTAMSMANALVEHVVLPLGSYRNIISD
jgi:hypothetical protein